MNKYNFNYDNYFDYDNYYHFWCLLQVQVENQEQKEERRQDQKKKKGPVVPRGYEEWDRCEH